METANGVPSAPGVTKGPDIEVMDISNYLLRL